MKQLREALLVEWPDADPLSLAVAARCRLPLVQVTPRGLWGRSGQVALTTAEHWLGRPAGPAPAPDSTVLRYLAAFGPASVKDMQTWAGLTRLREAFERLRPRARSPSATRTASNSSTSRTRPARPPTPRRRPASCPSSTICSSPTPTAPAWCPPTSRAVPGREPGVPHLLVDGFLAGLWRLEEDALTLEPFGTLTRAQRQRVAGGRADARGDGRGTDRTTSGSAPSYGHEAKDRPTGSR